MVLALLVLAGLLLRTTGIGFLLPQLSEPDGVVIDKQVEILRGGPRAGEGKHLYAFYPHLVARLAATLPQAGPEATAPRTLDEHLESARTHRRNIRFVVALLSLLAVPGTWLLARRFLPEPWPLLAAALVAMSVFQIWFAQQARPHAAEASLALLAVVAAIVVRRTGSWSAFAIAGAMLGLAVGCLQNGLAVLPALLLAVGLRWRAREDGALRLALGTLLALGITALCVRLYYPFLFAAHPKGEVGADGSFLKISGHLIDLSLFNGKGFVTVVRSFWEYDPLIATLAAIGLAFAVPDLVRRRSALPRAMREELWIVFAFVIPYAIAIGLYQRTYQRFALPLVPYECILAAYALYRGVSAAERRGDFARRVAVALAMIVILFQAWAAWKLVDVRSRPDTITQAARWIEANVPPAARVSMLPSFDLPLMQSASARAANAETTRNESFPWFTYQWDLPAGAYVGPEWNLFAMPLGSDARREAARADPAAFVRAQDADYVVLEVFEGARRPLLGAIRNATAAQGNLVARISPDTIDRGENLPLLYQDDEFPYTTPWFTRTLRARSVGPVIEIYRLR